LTVAAKNSAGLLLYRLGDPVEVLLGHMGGPFWARKDDRGWTIPKGEHEPDEDAFAAALREFTEEFGAAPPDADFVDLGSERQRGGKRVRIWAAAGDFDPSTIVSNTFELEWPPRSGRMQIFPEIDRAAWFDLATAREKLVAGQVVFLDRLLESL
jgi:predicted NUDIX family NTP pyrophosphohydrolase